MYGLKPIPFSEPGPLQNKTLFEARTLRWLSLCRGAEHERGEEQRQIEHGDFEQIACQQAALGFRFGAKNSSEANGVREIDEAERECGRNVGGSGEAELPGRETDGDH